MPLSGLCSVDIHERASNELDRLLSGPGLASHFQVILDLESMRPLGFEALVRMPDSDVFATPAELFAAAQREARLAELNLRCLRLAVARFAALGLSGKLFLNTLPDGLATPAELFQAEGSALEPGRVVLELSELYPFKDVAALQAFSSDARRNGLELALDDLGTGYSGLKTWSQLHPEYIKIDRHFISDIHCDTVKREFVRSIIEIARGLRCHVIAEGVETLDELLTLRMLHVRYVQGYLIHRPEAAPPQQFRVNGLGQVALAAKGPMVRPSETVAAITEWVAPLQVDTRAEMVNEFFQKNPEFESLPIVDGAQPVGMVTRRIITERFSERYAYALNWRKPIGDLAASPLVLDWNTPMQEVSRLVTARAVTDMSQDILVTRNGAYAGIARISALLKNITEMQIRSARYSNPLTQLPGNVPIYEEVDALLRAAASFRIAYVDINNFKPFNDHYGYSLGDEVITCLAGTLCDAVKGEDDFVGHIGGDDFVILFRSPDWERRCRALIAEFARRARDFYRPEDLAAGYILGEDRTGQAMQFPLLSLSVGVAHPDPEHCFSHHDVAALASEAKHEAKLAGADSLFINRRRRPARPLSPERAVSAHSEAPPAAVAAR